MKALQYYGKKDLRLEDIPEPVAGDGEIKIKVSYAGICGTDYEEYLYGPLWVTKEPHPLTGHGLNNGPVVLGHEFSGKVTAVGKGVTKVVEGDRVAVHPMIVCGKCKNCLAGNYYLCSNIGCVGLHRNGGFQEYCVVPEWNVFKIPDALSEKHAAAAEPVGFALNSVDLMNLSVGEDVAVFGAGLIGLLYQQVARVCGARRVTMIARRKLRLDVSKELGADVVIDVESEDFKEKIMSMTGGLGVDSVFEATGSTNVLDQVFEVVKSGGKIVLGGVFPKDVTLDLKKIVNCGRTVIGAVAHNPIHFETALQMLSDGRINVDPIITKVVSLDDAIEEGFKDYLANKGDNIKLMIKP
jgi:(R,R)-butanediol dehydrogenase/meso-butanediol dehydrogenase/diacetyl reductase